MVENNESEGPLIEGKYCAYTEKNCLIKDKYNEVRQGVIGLKRRVDSIITIEDWEQIKAYLLKRLDKLFEDSTFGTRECWVGIENGKDVWKNEVNNQINEKRCEGWTKENEETRDFYIKLEKFIIDFPELSDGIINLYKKKRDKKNAK